LLPDADAGDVASLTTVARARANVQYNFMTDDEKLLSRNVFDKMSKMSKLHRSKMYRRLTGYWLYPLTTQHFTVQLTRDRELQTMQ